MAVKKNDRQKKLQVEWGVSGCLVEQVCDRSQGWRGCGWRDLARHSGVFTAATLGAAEPWAVTRGDSSVVGVGARIRARFSLSVCVRGHSAHVRGQVSLFFLSSASCLRDLRGASQPSRAGVRSLCAPEGPVGRVPRRIRTGQKERKKKGGHLPCCWRAWLFSRSIYARSMVVLRTQS